MKISRCIAAALLVASTSAAGCSSCAKDDSAPAPAPVSSDTPATALTNRKASGLPRHFERRNPPGIENLAPAITDAAAQPAPTAVADAGTDATTH